MGTNFYLHKLPTKERKQQIKNAIDSNDFKLIKSLVYDTYDKYEVIGGNPTGGVIHLGKRSGGWKFLWNPNVYVVRHGHQVIKEKTETSTSYGWVQEPSTLYYTYPLSKEGIWNFINQPNSEIYDEYGELQDKETFFKEAVEWTTWNGEEAWDSKSYEEYEKANNPYHRIYIESGELIDLLEQEGFNFISESNSDFYSDGLRFSTNTDFS